MANHASGVCRHDAVARGEHAAGLLVEPKQEARPRRVGDAGELAHRVAANGHRFLFAHALFAATTIERVLAQAVRANIDV